MASRSLSDDTIVAISTPPGRGGIGVVRLSGAEARAIAEPLLRLRKPLEAGRARFAQIVDTSDDSKTHVSEARRGAPGVSYRNEGNTA